MIAGNFLEITTMKIQPNMVKPEKPFTLNERKTANARSAGKSTGRGTPKVFARSVWKKVTPTQETNQLKGKIHERGRTQRGGNFSNTAQFARSAFRGFVPTLNWEWSKGLRLVRP